MGAFTQNTDNFQSTFSTYQDGNLSLGAGQNPNIITGNQLGSPHNAVANFTMGIASGYSENNCVSYCRHRLHGNSVFHNR